MKLGKVLMGLVLILIGALLLVINLAIIPGMRLYNQWPLILVFIGLCMHFEVIDNRGAWGLLIPGGILFSYGLLFFICANFNWRYMITWWPIFPMGVGFGLLEAYFFGKKSPGLLIAGTIVGAVGLVFLIQNLLSIENIVLPIALIVAGLLVLLLGARKGRKAE